MYSMCTIMTVETRNLNLLSNDCFKKHFQDYTSVIIPSGLINTSRDRDRETKRVREIVG